MLKPPGFHLSFTGRDGYRLRRFPAQEREAGGWAGIGGPAKRTLMSMRKFFSSALFCLRRLRT
jgi:hypothetical protein